MNLPDVEDYLEIMRDNHENVVPVSMTCRGLQPFKEIPGTDTHSESDTLLWIQNQRPPSSKVPAILGENPFVEWVNARGACICLFQFGSLGTTNMQTYSLKRSRFKNMEGIITVYMTWRRTRIRKIRRQLLNAELRHWKLWWKKRSTGAQSAWKVYKTIRKHPKNSYPSYPWSMWFHGDANGTQACQLGKHF